MLPDAPLVSCPCLARLPHHSTANRLAAAVLPFILAVLAFVLALPPAQAQSDSARRVALVIGNAAYADLPLANPVNDAEDLSAKLRQLGFEVTTLTNRNRSQMTQAIVRFGQVAQGADAVLFYFAGHGAQVRGRNYLLPTGQRLQTEAEVEADAVDVNLVLARLEEAGSKVSLLILDACRNNPLARGGRSVNRGLARMEAPSGALVAFAAQPGAEAKDGGGRNGTYTKHLLSHIGTPGLSVEQMFKRVRADVERETARSQSPREESSLTADFFFVAPSPGGARIQNEASAAEEQAWVACRVSVSLIPCEDYLRRYPTGGLAPLAQARLKEMRSAENAIREAQYASRRLVSPCEVKRFNGGRLSVLLQLDKECRVAGETVRRINKIGFYGSDPFNGKIGACGRDAGAWNLAHPNAALAHMQSIGCVDILLKSGFVVMDILEGRSDSPPAELPFNKGFPPRCPKAADGAYEIGEGTICYIHEPERRKVGMAGDLKWQVAECNRPDDRLDQLMHDSERTYNILSNGECAIFWFFFDKTLPKGDVRIALNR